MERTQMTDELTPIETIAKELSEGLEQRLNDFLERPGGDAESERRRAELKTFLWDNKVGLLRTAQAYGPLVADLRETLKAVLHHYGPEGANVVTTHVMAARKSRESNEEIDRLERMFEPL